MKLYCFIFAFIFVHIIYAQSPCSISIDRMENIIQQSNENTDLIDNINRRLSAKKIELKELEQTNSYFRNEANTLTDSIIYFKEQINNGIIEGESLDSMTIYATIDIIEESLAKLNDTLNNWQTYKRKQAKKIKRWEKQWEKKEFERRIQDTDTLVTKRMKIQIKRIVEEESFGMFKKSYIYEINSLNFLLAENKRLLTSYKKKVSVDTVYYHNSIEEMKAKLVRLEATIISSYKNISDLKQSIKKDTNDLVLIQSQQDDLNIELKNAELSTRYIHEINAISNCLTSLLKEELFFRVLTDMGEKGFEFQAILDLYKQGIDNSMSESEERMIFMLLKEYNKTILDLPEYEFIHLTPQTHLNNRYIGICSLDALGLEKNLFQNKILNGNTTMQSLKSAFEEGSAKIINIEVIKK
jgi:hypothetical protein